MSKIDQSLSTPAATPKGIFSNVKPLTNPGDAAIPRALMLVVSSNPDLVNDCLSPFFRHAMGQVYYYNLNETMVSKLSTPVASAIVTTFENFSEEFLFTTLSMMEDELEEPGSMDCYFQKTDDVESKRPSI